MKEEVTITITKDENDINVLVSGACTRSVLLASLAMFVNGCIGNNLFSVKDFLFALALESRKKPEESGQIITVKFPEAQK